MPGMQHENAPPNNFCSSLIRSVSIFAILFFFNFTSSNIQITNAYYNLSDFNSEMEQLTLIMLNNHVLITSIDLGKWWTPIYENNQLSLKIKPMFLININQLLTNPNKLYSHVLASIWKISHICLLNIK